MDNIIGLMCFIALFQEVAFSQPEYIHTFTSFACVPLFFITKYVHDD